MLNTNESNMYIIKNTPIMSLHETCEVQDICNIEWKKHIDTRDIAPEVTHPEANRQHKDLLPPMPECNLQIKANKKDYNKIKMPEADVPEEAKRKLNALLEEKYWDIVSKSAMDMGRTNLIELDIPTEGPCVSCRPYSIPLKYRDFVDEEIKQLEDAGIISRSMSDWASPNLVVPKKPPLQDLIHPVRSSLNSGCALIIEG